MNTIIEKIKAEVEWLKTTSISEESVSQDDNYYEGRISVCDDILNFLDTLLCEELEEAAKNYFDKNWGEGSWDIRDQVIEDFKAGAFWQKEQMMDEWLKDRDGCFWDGVNEGKKAMREQMMKEARDLIEAVEKYVVQGCSRSTLLAKKDKLKKLIISKDEEAGEEIH